MAKTKNVVKVREANVEREEAMRKLGELIKGIKVAMMTTVGEDGILHSRPMTSETQEFEGTLWFFSGRSTNTTEELLRNREVNLSYGKPEELRFVSVSGTAEVVSEREKMQELWNDIHKAWFPQGLNDPDLCLLKVEVSHAEYWDSPSGKMAEMAGFQKGTAAGKPLPEGTTLEHGEVELEPKARGAAASLSGASDDASDEIESHT